MEESFGVALNTIKLSQNKEAKFKSCIIMITDIFFWVDIRFKIFINSTALFKSRAEVGSSKSKILVSCTKL